MPQGPIHRVRTFTAALIAVLCLTVPTVASASSFYVDQETGDDTNSCAAPAIDACEHIQAAVNKAGAGDTVHVSDPVATTVYPETVNLDSGKSLVSDSPDPADNVIGGGMLPNAAVTTSGPVGGAPSVVSGFTLEGRHGSLLVGRRSEIKSNIFDEDEQVLGGFASDMILDNGSAGSVISGNEFVGGNATVTNQTAIATSTTGTAEIVDNHFAGFNTSISVGGDDSNTPLIADNVIAGIRDGGAGGIGIRVTRGHPAISHNTIEDPIIGAPSDFLVGVAITSAPGPNATGASLSRNRIIGMKRGVQVQDAEGAVTFDGDLITQSSDYPLLAIDSNVDDAGVADVAAVNVTFVDSGSVSLDGTNLDLDSSVIGSGGITTSAGGGTCAITFSRGPSTSGSDCETFQTDAAPGFVDPATGDYHLVSASTLIDSGNPVAPGASELDFDGDAFGRSSTCPLVSGTRDIGADEFKPACVPDPPPPPNPDPDTDPPETVISHHPPAKSKLRSARFTFTSDEAGATYSCSIDGGTFAPCSSPLKLKRLKRSSHNVAVEATDLSENVDPTPAKFRFKVTRRQRQR